MKIKRADKEKYYTYLDDMMAKEARLDRLRETAYSPKIPHMSHAPGSAGTCDLMAERIVSMVDAERDFAQAWDRLIDYRLKLAVEYNLTPKEIIFRLGG